MYVRVISEADMHRISKHQAINFLFRSYESFSEMGKYCVTWHLREDIFTYLNAISETNQEFNLATFIYILI